jgi:hypothetical protein
MHISYGYHRLLGKADFTDLLEIAQVFICGKRGRPYIYAFYCLDQIQSGYALRDVGTESAKLFYLHRYLRPFSG